MHRFYNSQGRSYTVSDVQRSTQGQELTMEVLYDGATSLQQLPLREHLEDSVMPQQREEWPPITRMPPVPARGRSRIPLDSYGNPERGVQPGDR